MANPEVTRRGSGAAPGAYVLRPGTLVSAAVAVCLAQVALAIPAVLNGMFTTDLGPTTPSATSSAPPGPRRPAPPGHRSAAGRP